MNARQKALLEKLERLGRLSIEEEAAALAVSTMTIRRDIREFESRGLAVATKGGAAPKSPTREMLFAQPKSSEAKIRIAQKAAEMVVPGSTVMLSAGTTTLEVARRLAAADKHVSVLTNSLPAAAALFQTKAQVILTGGSLRPNSLDLTGPVAEKNIEEYYIDTLITGCDGVSGEGFFTTDLGLAEMEKKSVRKSGKVIVVTESRKFQKPSLVRFASISDAAAVITDKDIPQNFRDILSSSGVELIIV
jgi:DeoR/GlpR family transcriptional regulator of sugar metabolism